MQTKREENYEEKLGNYSELQGPQDRCLLKLEQPQDDISEYSLNLNHIAQQLCSNLGNNGNPIDFCNPDYHPLGGSSSSQSSSNLLSRYLDHQSLGNDTQSQQNGNLFETDYQQQTENYGISDHKDDDQIFDMFIEDAYQKQENQDDQSVFVDQQLHEKFHQNNTQNSLFTRNFESEGFLPFKKTFTMKTEENCKIQEEEPQNQENVIVTENNKDIVITADQQNEQLDPFQEEDFEEPELCFELPDFGGEEENKNLGKKDGKKPMEIWKVTQKISSEKKKKEYDKNICRYISRCIVRCFVHQNYNKKIYALALDILQKESQDIILAKFNLENKDAINFEVLKYELYNLAKEYMLGEIENLTGHRALQDILCYNDEQVYLEKKLFRTFSKWFLKERATRYILAGNMKNKGSYINYKNKVMLYYIEKPEQWISNHVRVRKR